MATLGLRMPKSRRNLVRQVEIAKETSVIQLILLPLTEKLSALKSEEFFEEGRGMTSDAGEMFAVAEGTIPR